MSATILIVDDEEGARRNIRAHLNLHGYEVIDVATLAEARAVITQGRADIILLDVELPDGYGPSLLQETAHLPARPPVIVFTAYGRIEMAVEAMNSGAHYFLSKPINFKDLNRHIQSAEEIVAMRRELAHLRQAQSGEVGFVVGQTAAMQAVLQQARRAALARVSVLISGETGSGKEVLARAIHQMNPAPEKRTSPRPFIAINCAAIQNTVLESELFGYEPGAFTGADKRKLGLMEIADGGVLFLDEISSMPLDIQAKLLRALDERAFRRVGGHNLIQVDVQVLAASNRDLAALAAQEKFREDLYYRLKVVELNIPPLRQRQADIPELVGAFIRQNNLRMGLAIDGVTPAALHALTHYRWPGNIRELRNAIERAMLFCDEAQVDLGHLPAEVQQCAPLPDPAQLEA